MQAFLSFILIPILFIQALFPAGAIPGRLGNRYQSTANGQTTTYALDLAGGLSQVLSDGAHTYLYGLDRLAQQSADSTGTFLPDGLGSVRQIANASGMVGQPWAYDPFGNPLGNPPSHYGFAGEWTDGTGLQYLRARYYSPAQGRFITQDPFPGYMTQPSTLNPYTYVTNDPATLTDPSGENPFLIAAGVGGLLGGAIYGYGSQVVRNLGQGMCFWNALSYNISAGEVALYAGVGGILGFGMGGATMGIQAAVAYLGIGTTIGTQLSADGDPTNKVKAVVQGFGNLSQGLRYGIQQASQLKNVVSGTGLQVHHIIEQRFAPALEQSTAQARQWLSVAVTPEEHQAFTNAWRSAIGYINSGNPINTGTVTIDRLWLEAQDIYSQYPALLEAARQTIFGQ